MPACMHGVDGTWGGRAPSRCRVHAFLALRVFCDAEDDCRTGNGYGSRHPTSSPDGGVAGLRVYVVSMVELFRGLLKHLGPVAVIRTQILPSTCVASSKHWHALQSVTLQQQGGGARVCALGQRLAHRARSKRNKAAARAVWCISGDASLGASASLWI